MLNYFKNFKSNYIYIYTIKDIFFFLKLFFIYLILYLFYKDVFFYNYINFIIKIILYLYLFILFIIIYNSTILYKLKNYNNNYINTIRDILIINNKQFLIETLLVRYINIFVFFNYYIFNLTQLKLFLEILFTWFNNLYIFNLLNNISYKFIFLNRNYTWNSIYKQYSIFGYYISTRLKYKNLKTENIKKLKY
uniref:Ymf75 n=1 Tax=Ichthyophthirius multifiliis TaxID=5932 RepID=G1FLC3_ICHMU|nr:Ymf75 [Ichthyophthirius multifiliis]AEL89265.1 Ymf75 [Ichthyophthirius multifiliis]